MTTPLHFARASVHRRVLSIGDLHGDFAQTSGILRSLGLMNEAGGWSGGRDVLIQTGDIADRGHQEFDVYRALFRLQDEAPASGGEVIMLLGNHELMNLQGDFTYASSKAGSASEDRLANRSDAFGPAGWLGKRLRQRAQVVARIGEEYGFSHPVLYAHAGILPEVAASLDVQSNDSETHQGGQHAADALNAAVRRRLWNKTSSELRGDKDVYFSDAGPMWTRHLARSRDAGLCVELEQSLRVFGATRMVVGHTPQTDGKVHHRCLGRLVLADTIISSAYNGGGHPSAVEVGSRGEAFALYPGESSAHLRIVLPPVDFLVNEKAVNVAGGGLTPQLRWQLKALGLDQDGESCESNSASGLPPLKQVRRAYHRLSLVRHPDKGGTHEEFRELQAAFEGVLTALGAS